MAVSPEVAKAQAEYAARPFLARIETSHFSGTFRFSTEGEAVDYILAQFSQFRESVSAGAYGNDWTSFDQQRSHIKYPSGDIMQARWFLLGADEDARQCARP